MNHIDTIDPTAKAYSYTRYSTPEQAQGDSLRRQTAMADEWCKRHGVTLDTELVFSDLGVSGYRGKNAHSGELRAFRDAVIEGMAPRSPPSSDTTTSTT